MESTAISPQETPPIFYFNYKKNSTYKIDVDIIKLSVFEHRRN